MSNGIRVISERIPQGRSVSIGIWVRCGSGYETQDNNGIAHFMEHMFFKGTRARSAREIAHSLESLGGNLNAATGKELSVYTALVIDEHMPVAVDVLLDLVQNPLFSPHDISREKKVVLTEINHALEDPEEMVLDFFYMNLFQDHPLGYLIYGNAKNVKKFTRQNLIDFLHQFYRPERMVMAAAGRVDHDAFVAEVEKRISVQEVSCGEMPVWPLQPPDQPACQAGARHRHVHSAMQQAHICTGFRLFPYGDPRKYAMILLDMLFGSGMSSRLFQNIREKYGFAYSVYSFVDFMSSTGVFGSYMACDSRKVDMALDLLQREFAKLRRQGVSQGELDMIKRQARGNIILGLEGSSRRMHKIAETEIYDTDHLKPEEVVRKVESVTTVQIAELVEAVMDESQRVTTLLVPH